MKKVKKVILCLSPIMVGLLSGAFFEFFLQAVALMTSPVVDYSLLPYRNLCIIIAAVLFLFIAFFVTINIVALINLDSPKTKWIILAQIGVVFLFFMVSWGVFNPLVNHWYDAYGDYYKPYKPTSI